MMFILKTVIILKSKKSIDASNDISMTRTKQFYIEIDSIDNQITKPQPHIIKSKHVNNTPT
jgi:hypothetical protein